jgi:glyoxylase-like metal-dependent hydrolase (beta-lactamase superfamily II)
MRYFLWLLVIATSLGPSANTVALEYASVPVDMKPVQVSQHAYYVPGGTGIATDNYGFVSNSAFVVTDEGVIVFDTLGTPALGAGLLKAIRTVTDAPVTTIYISHYHADHMYGTQAFSESGAEVVAPDGAKRYLEGEVAERRLAERRVSLSPWVDSNTRIVEPDRYVQGEERFTLGGVNIRVVDVGSAHSEGDLILFVEDDGVLFSGDIIFEGRIPFLGTSNSDDWLEILIEMEKADVKVIVPGSTTGFRSTRLTRRSTGVISSSTPPSSRPIDAMPTEFTFRWNRNRCNRSSIVYRGKRHASGNLLKTTRYKIPIHRTAA